MAQLFKHKRPILDILSPSTHIAHSIIVICHRGDDVCIPMPSIRHLHALWCVVVYRGGNKGSLE